MTNKKFNREISIIYDLLFGYTDKMQQLREKLDTGSFKLPVEIALVLKILDYPLLVQGNSEFRIEEIKRELINRIKFLAEKYSSDVLTDFIEEDTIILFISSEFIDNIRVKDGVIKFASILKENLESETNYSFSIGIGRKYEDLKGLIFSYKEARNACTNGYFIGEELAHIDNLVVFKKDIPIFISEMEAELIQQIRDKEVENFNTLFLKLTGSIIEERLEPEIIKTRIMEVAFKVMRELDIEESLQSISGLMEKILAVKTKKELIELVNDLASRFFGFLQRSNKYQNTNQEINKALAYIDKNFKKDLTLEEISQEVGLSLYYFSHLFKEETGKTFVSYLNKLRINKAKHLLRNVDLNIAEVGYQVGYNDPNYFTRVFKEYENMTPSQYRKEHIDNIL